MGSPYEVSYSERIEKPIPKPRDPFEITPDPNYSRKTLPEHSISSIGYGYTTQKKPNRR